MAQQTAVICMALGATGVDVPDLAAKRAQFDRDLCSGGVDEDDERATLLRAVGLGR